ncbi:Hypothetical protein SCF082_LOCUS36442 [Durusdinium trenchii]|uniref:Uncharacterized protein n=1 Tax=Durusdinium trenchii TaxID=1381693 RepID=A0ABP0PG67_9DINO
MSRSVSLLEELAETDDAINLNRRGYCFFAGSDAGTKADLPEAGRALERFGVQASSFGAGPLRRHDGSPIGRRRSPANGFRGPTGLDLVYGPELIQEIYPFVTSKAQVMLHARRCGWLDAQALGRAMLTASGGQVLRGEALSGTSLSGHAGKLRGNHYQAERIPVLVQVVGFDTHQGAVTAVQVQQNDGVAVSLKCDAFVNAAGKGEQAAGGAAVAFEERGSRQSVCPPVITFALQRILNDVQAATERRVRSREFAHLRDLKGVPTDVLTPATLPTEEPLKQLEEFLLELDDTATGGMVNSASWLAKQPGGQHLRPCGNGRVLLLWEHLHRHVPVPEDPEMPISDFLEMYPELCVRGLKEMVTLGSNGRCERGRLLGGGRCRMC